MSDGSGDDAGFSFLTMLMVRSSIITVALIAAMLTMFLLPKNALDRFSEFQMQAMIFVGALLIVCLPDLVLYLIKRRRSR